jgi:hypothetical protein
MNQTPGHPPTLAYGSVPPGGRITIEQGEDSVTIVVRPPTLWRAVRGAAPGLALVAATLAAVARIPLGNDAPARLAVIVSGCLLLAILVAAVARLARLGTTLRVAGGELEVRRGEAARSWRREEIAYVRARWGSLNVRGRRHGTHAWFPLALGRDERAWLANALTRALELPTPAA